MASSFSSSTIWPPTLPSPPHRTLRRRRAAAFVAAALPELSNAAGGGGGDGAATLAAVSGGAIAVLAAALAAADPEKRRRAQAAAAAATTSGGDGGDKAAVREYFNTSGFDRWRRIYGDGDDVNSVQLDIRQGHAETVAKTITWLRDDELPGTTICDAGCGTGSLAIPLALEGAIVFASDISSSMVSEAQKRASQMIQPSSVAASSSPSAATSSVSASARVPQFSAQDLESLSGKYHTVTCLDVLIHYPQDKAGDMIKHLASLAERRLLISFAPKTWYYSLLKRIGELFPGPSKATRAYLHAEEDVEAALNSAGWVVRRRDMTATRFYFSRLLEAVPKS